MRGRLGLLALPLLGALVLVACQGQPAASTGSVSSEEPSARALAYAKDLGGTSHKGESLFVIVGDSVPTEAEAEALLDAATPRFGDMQSYFIVQRSDNFDALSPGSWVVVEAYRASPSSENVAFANRGFPGAYVRRVTVRTTDPIPVYEDLVLK